MKLIATVNSAGSANTIIFANIPQTFDDLFVFASLRSTATGNQGQDGIGLTFNNTFSGQFTRSLDGDGSSATSNSAAYRSIGVAPNADNTSNTFGNTSIYIPNYRSTVNKTASGDTVFENNATLARQHLCAYLQTLTVPINQITLDTSASGQNWIVGSTVSLYGILKGSDGIVTTS